MLDAVGDFPSSDNNLFLTPHDNTIISFYLIFETTPYVLSVYFDHPSEWSFDAPGGITSTEAKEGLAIHGTTIVKDMLFDITDDATGEVHEMAEKTLLPFVNEVTVDGKKLKQIQNVDSSHHDDGSLHYLLRKGFKLTRNKTAELLFTTALITMRIAIESTLHTSTGRSPKMLTAPQVTATTTAIAVRMRAVVVIAITAMTITVIVKTKERTRRRPTTLLNQQLKRQLVIPKTKISRQTRSRPYRCGQVRHGFEC